MVECVLEIIKTLRMVSYLFTNGVGSSYGCCSIPCAPSNDNKRDKKNKTSLQSVTIESQTNAHLARIPVRMSMNGSSNIACMFNQQHRKGTVPNQDAMVVWEVQTQDLLVAQVIIFDGSGLIWISSFVL